MKIRDAVAADQRAIHDLVAAAFERSDEADLVDRLRADGDALVELAAEHYDAIVGHVLYSRLTIERDGGAINAAALAPVSVAPSLQRQGIGAALIRAGNERCRALGLQAIIVVGHPDYYPQFGFSAKTAESLNAPFSGSAFMALELLPGALEAGGRVRYAAAFGV